MPLQPSQYHAHHGSVGLRGVTPPPVTYSPLATLTGLDDYFLSTLGVGQSGGVADSWTSQILSHVLAATGTERPAVATHTNGVQTIRFDGSNDYLVKASGYDVVSASETDLYVSYVYERVGSTPNDVPVDLDGAATAQLLDVNDTSTQHKSWVTGSASVAINVSDGDLMTVEHVVTGGNYELFVNGSGSGSTSHTTLIASVALAFGARTTGALNAQADLFEFCIQTGSVPSAGTRTSYRSATYAQYGHTGS